MVKIDIISGFLGAGKTTLIKKLLKDGFQGEQVVLIENEFGEIGIDGGFLKEAGIQIREMNSGCICCSLVGDFGTSLKEVVTKYNPDRILIEPSGVGKLSDVIKAVQGVQDEVDIKLNSYTTVVDAKKCKMYMKNFGEFFDNQIQYAGAIIMSRTDIASEKKVQESLELLRSLNKDAAIITTPIENLDGKKLVEVMEHPVSLEQEMLEEEHEHHHHHDGECGCGHDHEHEHHHHDGECGCGHDHHQDHTHAHDHAGCGCGCGHDHGHEENQGVSVQFSGVFNLPKEQVWSLLTENDKLQSWYPELEFQGLETGASLKFNYKTGGHEDMMVLDVEPNAYLSFTWDLNIVTFELHELEPG